LIIGVCLVTFAGWPAWLLTQFIPHFVASALGSYLFYAQHNFATVTFESKAGWTYEKAAMESSSFMKTSRIMAWFTGNIGYHHIHHLNARIPFYRLPEVFNALPELRNHPKTTSLSPADVFRCLRLKVWDADIGKMVPLPHR
jgi:omega-6 fatty acid desaturase (delta-12 desaturase)